MAKLAASSANLSMAAAASGMVAACILLLCVGAPVAMAQSCTTNGNSPTQGDANTCVQYVRNLGSSQCCQVNGSGCTNMCSSGSAAVDICGPQGSCTACSNAGNSLNTILAGCVANVGGVARVSGSIASSPFTFQIRRS